MKKLFLLLFLLCVFAVTSKAATISVQSTTIPGFSGSSSATYQLWVFSNSSWVDVGGVLHGAGNTTDKVWTQRVTGLTYNSSTHALTIPAFSLTSTRDALQNPSVRLYFWIMQVTGVNATPIKILPGTENGLTIPATLTSSSGCAPSGTCATFADLIRYNVGSPQLPSDGYYTRNDVDRLIATQLVGAPAGATYITQTANSTLTNEQATGDLATGLLKNTTNTGVLSIAVAGTDYENPLTFSAPLSRSTNTISIPAASSSVNGYLSSTDWTTFNNKQAALGYTPENLANKNATNGYAGLSSGLLTRSQGQEVWSLADLSDATGASGTGTTVLKGTFTSPTSGQVPAWNGTDWVNTTLTNTGTVTSVGLSTDSSFLTVGSSPVTTSGTITLNLTTGLTANRVVATPDSTTGTVSLRALVNNDLPIVSFAKGGLGGDYSSAANGRIPIGNGSGFTVANLTAGSNITITNSAGGITIAAASSSPHNILSSTHSDTTAASIVRGDVLTGQGSGTATLARLAIGSANRYLSSDGTDVSWGQVSLTAGVTGILPAANGGLGVSGASAANGQVPIGNGSGFTLATLTAGSNITITNSAGTIQIDASGSLGTAWDNLTSPASANLALSMAAKTTVFTWGNATSTSDLFTLKDSASNSGTGHILMVNSAASSSAKPVIFAAGGTTNGVEMNTSGVLAPIGTGGITANALNGVSGNGIQVRTSAGNFTSRSIAAGVGIAVTNGDGVSGNPTIAADLSTLVASQTLWDSSQSSRTLTAGLSGSNDPVITFSDNTVNVSTGTLQQGGTAVVLQSRTLTGGTGINTIGDLSTDRTISVNQGFSPTWTGVHIFTPTARTSGAASYFTVNIPADTGQTASTEAIGFKTVTATRTWATGGITTQRENVFAAPTYAFSGTSTVTNAATVAISGAPIAGSNATLTNKYALWVQADDVLFAGLIKAGSTPTTLTDSAGKILSAALNTVGAGVGGTGLDTSGSTGIPLISAGTWSVLSTTGSGNVVRATSPSLTTPSFSSIVNTGTLTLPTSTDTLVGKATTDTFTNKTIDAEATGNSISIPIKLWIDGAGLSGTSATSNWDIDATAAPTANSAVGSNVLADATLDFADGATQRYAFRKWILPSDWTSTGGVDVKILWTASGTSTNAVKWEFSCGCSASGETADASFNTVSTVTTSKSSTANLINVSSITGLTISNCAASEVMFLKLRRLSNDAADTLTVDARLVGVEITARRAM